MKAPPKKLEKKAIETACRYRDSVDRVPFRIQQRLYDKAKRAFEACTRAMGCTPEETWMVSENLGHMVNQIPQRSLVPGRDY